MSLVTVTDAEWRSFDDYVPWMADDHASAQIRVDDLGSWQAAALAYTRKRLNEMLDSPSSFSVPEYSESWSSNISELRKSIETLEGLVPADEGGGAFGVGKLVRHGRGRASGYR